MRTTIVFEHRLSYVTAHVAPPRQTPRLLRFAVTDNASITCQPLEDAPEIGVPKRRVSA